MNSGMFFSVAQYENVKFQKKKKFTYAQKCSKLKQIGHLLLLH